MVVLDINPSISGIAGDMLGVALLGISETPDDLLESVTSAISEEVPDFHAVIKSKSYGDVSGNFLELENEKDSLSLEKLQSLVEKLLEKLAIEGIYRDIAKSVLDYLLEAEQDFHKTEEIHLHELGTVDTLFDIIITAFCLQKLGVTSIVIHPVNTGMGTVNTAHGILPVPAPATQYILEKHELLTIASVHGEATTPTGAALLAAIKNHLEEAESVIWEKNGYSFGTKEFEDRGNMVRVRLGRTTEESQHIEVLETNLDDISGEFLGHAMTKLLEYGALDVNYYPIFMKKNRPAYTLRVLSNPEDSDRIAKEIQRLTGTLGIRVMKVDRHLGRRSFAKRTIYVREWDSTIEITVKIGSRSKFEFDELVELAEQYHLTPLEVREILNNALEE